MSFQDQFDWPKRFIPGMRAICQAYQASLIQLREATFDEDTKEATDLVILEMPKKRVACRIRSAIPDKFGLTYFDRYPTQFTIREYCRGHETELAKIMAGWGQLFLYCFAADQQSTAIAYYSLLCLDSFRMQMKQFPEEITSQEVDNHDGTFGRAFNIPSFRKGLVLATNIPQLLKAPEPARQAPKPKAAPAPTQGSLL